MFVPKTMTKRIVFLYICCEASQLNPVGTTNKVIMPRKDRMYSAFLSTKETFIFCVI